MCEVPATSAGGRRPRRLQIKVVELLAYRRSHIQEPACFPEIAGPGACLPAGSSTRRSACRRWWSRGPAGRPAGGRKERSARESPRGCVDHSGWEPTGDRFKIQILNGLACVGGHLGVACACTAGWEGGPCAGTAVCNWEVWWAFFSFTNSPENGRNDL